VTPLSGYLLIALVLLPLVTAALMLLMGEGRRPAKAIVNVFSTATGLAIAVMLLLGVIESEAPAAFSVYLSGNWPVPFGIVLVADRLSALMLVLTGCVGIAALLFALARWQHAGVYFHALFQLQLMGLYGAFLTADLFNLFVFFEVFLAASYGLLLYGGGGKRVRAGLHYIAINLVASLLFLIGVAVIYGVTGTLNMADIAEKISLIPDGDRGLLHAGAAILAIAFLAKAGFWPLNFWLLPAYAAASAPAAAMFAILTKVGVYAVLRLWTLCFPPDAGTSAGFGGEALVLGGIATLGLGALGMLGSHHLARLASYAVIVSSGTFIGVMGFGSAALTGGALYYLASSTLAGCALFLLVELLERTRQIEVGPQHLDDGRQALPSFQDIEPPPGINLDDDRVALTGRPIPAALVILGLAFAALALVTAGLPPLSGFIGKLAMLTALLELGTPTAWMLFALLLLSGLCGAVGLMRIGVRHFWITQDRPSPHLSIIETLPIAALLAGIMLMVGFAEPLMREAQATAESLQTPRLYIDAVMSTRPVGAEEAAP